MKSFEAVRGYLRWMGIVRLDSSYSEIIFTRTLICSFYTIFIGHLFAEFSFLFLDAQSFRDYAEVSFYLGYALLVLSWYSSHFMHRQKYADIFIELDTIIAKSK